MDVVNAPAKLTVSLRITGVRDDGYHLIDAEMVSLDLADTLEIDPDGHGIELVFDGPAAARPGLNVSVGPDNLVARALALVGRTAGVRIVKRIPAGAGLGGGSADAAAILRWAGCTDVELAARLGADVPFCVVGGRARVGGVGDVLEPLGIEPRTFTLVIPPFGCSTVAVYRAWDDLGSPTGTAGNDLEPAALVVEPELERWRDRLAISTGRRPTLAGSGSTWFVDGAYPGPDHWVVRTGG